MRGRGLPRAVLGGVLPLCALAALAALVGACNALLGNEERTLDDLALGDGSPSSRDGSPSSDAPDDTSAPADGGSDVDAAPIVIEVTGPWTSPNGAPSTTTDAGVRITGVGSATHPVIVPATQPNVTSDNYTIEAVVFAPSKSEFGILGRLQTNTNSVLMGSIYGSGNQPFIGWVASSDWNPAEPSYGLAYTFNAGARYHMKLRFEGDIARIKMWDGATAEPAGFEKATSAKYLTGRGVGFYVYSTTGTYDAVLERVTITIP